MVIKKQMGSNVPAGFFDVYAMQVEWDAVGKANGNSPAAKMEKFRILFEQAKHPQSDIWVPELERAMLEELGTGIDPEKILGRQEKLRSAMQGALPAPGGVGNPGSPAATLPDAGMGMGQGVA